MRIHVRQLSPAAHVRHLIEHAHQRRGEPPRGQRCRVLLGLRENRHRQCAGDRPRGSSALLGNQVQGVSGGREAAVVELRPADFPGVPNPRDHRVVGEHVHPRAHRAVDTITLLGREALNLGQGLGQLAVPGGAQLTHRRVVLGVLRPAGYVRDRPARHGGGEDQVRQQPLTVRLEVRIRLRPRGRGRGHEHVCELFGAHHRGHERERVPPPRRRLTDDPLHVVDPHDALLRARPAREVHNVPFVGGRQHRAVGLHDLRHADTSGLARARTHDPGLHPLPRGIEHPPAVGELRQRHAWPRSVRVETGGVLGRGRAGHLLEIARPGHGPGQVVHARPRTTAGDFPPGHTQQGQQHERAHEGHDLPDAHGQLAPSLEHHHVKQPGPVRRASSEQSHPGPDADQAQHHAQCARGDHPSGVGHSRLSAPARARIRERQRWSSPNPGSCSCCPSPAP